ncbi:MAG: EutN/CcmL family microcompartment protein [Clostridia bacterium]|nr:EutN/CcmL family microcompartment protein [Clostridia bacterium]
MIIGKVIGSVVATRKNEKLIGSKFLIIESLKDMKQDETGDKFVAVDVIGAGIGDVVMVARGSAARLACDRQDAPCDAAVVGIIDDGTQLEK